MNAEEKRIAREIKLGFRKCVRNAPHWHEAQLGKIEHVQVKLNADGSYAYVSSFIPSRVASVSCGRFAGDARKSRRTGTRA